jgi:23S rRNA (guanosine2251-2'-O)-methyltransferase
MAKDIVVIAHNIRSAFNVGSIFRVCDGVGVTKLYLTGYTPFPQIDNDKRLNFEIEKTEKKIKKSGLEGFNNLPFKHAENIITLIKELKEKRFKIVGLEQHQNSVNIFDYKVTEKTAIIIGNEVSGVESQVLDNCDKIIEIPMYGKGKSLNVAVSLAVGLYTITH